MRPLFVYGGELLELNKVVFPFIRHYGLQVSKVSKLPALQKGDVCLVLGTEAVKELKQRGIVPRSKGIKGLRRDIYPWRDGHLVITYDPFVVHIEYERRQEIEWDTVRACRLLRTGSLEPIFGKHYAYADDLENLCKLVATHSAKTKRRVPLAMDLETVGLVPHRSDVWIVSIAFSAVKGYAWVLAFDQDSQPTQHSINTDSRAGRWWQQIKWLLTTQLAKVYGANLKFDLLWIKEKWGIDCTNFAMDTTLVGSLLDENRSNSLEVHAQLYTAIGGYDSQFNIAYNKGRMHEVRTQHPKDFLLYAGGDVDATLRVAHRLRSKLLRDVRLSEFYTRLLHPANEAFVKMEQRGVVVDIDRYEQLNSELEMKLDDLEKQAQDMFPGWLLGKHYVKGWSLTRAALIKDFLFSRKGLNLSPKDWTAKTKEPTTTLDHLLKFKDHPKAGPFVKLYQEYKATQKTHSVYVVGFLNHLREDGMFHPTYLLHRGDYGGEAAGTVCLAPYTPVLTNKGYLPASLIQVGMRVLTHKGKWQEVESVIDNGIKPVLLVSLESGHWLLTTRNHLYLTSEGWIEAQNLKIGQNVTVYGPSEQWRDIQQKPKYAVSNWGRVRYKPTGRLLIPTRKGKWGHLKFDLGTGAKRYTRGAHRFVAEAFVPNPKGYPEVRHLDGCAWNNVAWNLAWGTRKDNCEDGIRHGSYQGSRQAKLNWELVDAIRKANWYQGFDAFTAQQLGVSRELVRDVRLGKKWPYREIEEPFYDMQLSPIVEIKYIRDMQTIGLQVKEDHSHITAGIVTHNTGRTSCKDPAIQVLPKHTIWTKPLREVYVPPPGHVILAADYSQGELRVTACVAKEPEMLKAYLKGYDMHAVTAAAINGITYEQFIKKPTAWQEQARFGGKAGNFGLLYGMQVSGFREYVRATAGQQWSMKEAEQYRKAFFSKYSALLTWHEDSIAKAHKQGFIRSPLGRIRHLPLIDSPNAEVRSKAERQAINAPIQSTLSDMTIWAMARLNQAYPDLWIWSMTHDSLTFYVPEDQVDVWAKRIKEIMESLPFPKLGWHPALPFVVDVELGVRNYADLKKLEIK